MRERIASIALVIVQSYYPIVLIERLNRCSRGAQSDTNAVSDNEFSVGKMRDDFRD